MTTTSAVTLAVWALVAGRLAVLGSRHLRARPVHAVRALPAPAVPRQPRPLAPDQPNPADPAAAASRAWRPRVTSGCGR